MDVERSKRITERERNIYNLEKVLSGIFSSLKDSTPKPGVSMVSEDPETGKENKELIYTLKLGKKGTIVEISGYEPNKDRDILNSNNNVVINFTKDEGSVGDLGYIYTIIVSGGVTGDSSKNSENIRESLRTNPISFSVFDTKEARELELETGPGEVLKFINY